MRLAPRIVADIEWAVLALTGLIAITSLLGALYSIPWTWKSRQQATTRAFNYLWITRALLQVIAACYALSLDLRLQVLWSAKSAIIPGGYNVDAMCRLYIGLSFGLLEPSFLLLVLFACSHSVSKHSDPDSNPNLFIFALTVGLTLPMCAVQVFAALFSRIMTQLRYNEELMYKFFAASALTQDTMCPGEPDNPNCAVCLFPAFSTIISAAFALMYLLVLWAVLGRVAGAAINRMLARRIRLLQVCVALFFCASITLRGVTAVNVDPFSLDFVGLWFANVLVCCGLIVLVSAILVWVPVYDGRRANARLGSLMAAPLFPDAPTELLPLVGYGSTGFHRTKGSFYSHEPPSSDYDYSSHAGEEASSVAAAAAAAAAAPGLSGGGGGGAADEGSSSDGGGRLGGGAAAGEQGALLLGRAGGSGAERQSSLASQPSLPSRQQQQQQAGLSGSGATAHQQHSSSLLAAQADAAAAASSSTAALPAGGAHAAADAASVPEPGSIRSGAAAAVLQKRRRGGGQHGTSPSDLSAAGGAGTPDYGGGYYGAADGDGHPHRLLS